MPDPTPLAPDTAAVSPALYRAALGPVNTDHFLAVFARFDAAGRTSPVWNPVAAGMTLNWLAFRGLWSVLLVYALTLGGLLLAWWELRQALPKGVALGLLAALLVLCTVVPGFWGNALLHAQVRRRIADAVGKAAHLKEAVQRLQRQAGTQRRWKALALLNALVLAAGVAWLVSVNAPGAGSTPRASPAAEPPVPFAPEALAEAPEPRVLPAAEAPPPVVAEPIEVPVPVEAAVTEVNTAPPQPGPSAVALAEPEPEPEPEAQSAAVPAARVPAAAKPYAINVGLFAEKANAEQAHARLLEAGWPAYLQAVDGAGGSRTRVRVGPFAQRSQADAVARRIRALGLEAVVFGP